jgi:small conductance mechanosensitive channel
MDVLHGAYQSLLAMVTAVVTRLPMLAIAIAVFYAFYYGGKGVRSLVQRAFARSTNHHSAGLVLGRLAVGATTMVGFLVASVILFPTFHFKDLIGLLGIGSVAVGFAFRDVAQNYLAGVLLLLTEPFRIGDQIVVGSFEGTVEDIETRATTVKTYDGRRVVIPNANLFTESVTVNTAFDKRRTQYEVGIGYGDDIDTVRAHILKAVRGCEGVIADPAPDVLVVDLADFCVKLRVRWWTDPPLRNNILQVQDRCLTAIKNTLTAEGVDMPFPTSQVLFHDQTEEGDGDRKRQREGWPVGKAVAPKQGSIAGALRQVRALRARSSDGDDEAPAPKP